MINEAGVTEIRINHDHASLTFPPSLYTQLLVVFASKMGEVGQLPGGIPDVTQDIILLPSLPCTFYNN